MRIIIKNSKKELGRAAAKSGAIKINKSIYSKDYANIILATGASQFEMLGYLIKEKVDWSKVTAFHLDEYIGLKESHPASFRNYLRERFESKVNLKKFYFINADINPELECKRLNNIIMKYPIDVAFIGIGENGHLAFNDPPADFEIEDPYIIVDLDEKCRLQQLNEGWFPNIQSVPSSAVSMSIKHILKSKSIICTVPDRRKSIAVEAAVNGDISPIVPASILRKHEDTELFLDKSSASLIESTIE